MTIRSRKIARAIQNNQTSNPHSKYVLDGRVYNSEKYAGPLSVRKDVIKIMSYNEKVSASDLYNIERFLEGHKGIIKGNKIRKADREDIIKRYDLVYDISRWVGDEVSIFNKLCEKYPHAAKYKKYKGVLYAMRYGESPCDIYKED